MCGGEDGAGPWEVDSVGVGESDIGEAGTGIMLVEGVQIAVLGGIDEVCGAGVGEGKCGELLVAAFGPWAFGEAGFSRPKSWQNAKVEWKSVLIPTISPVVDHDLKVFPVVGFTDVAFALVPRCASDGVGDDGVEHGVELRGHWHPVEGAFGGEGGLFWCGGSEWWKGGFGACEPFAGEGDGFEFWVERDDGELSCGDAGVSGVPVQLDEEGVFAGFCGAFGKGGATGGVREMIGGGGLEDSSAVEVDGGERFACGIVESPCLTKLLGQVDFAAEPHDATVWAIEFRKRGWECGGAPCGIGCG